MNVSDAELISEFKDRVEMAKRVKELEQKLADSEAELARNKNALLESVNNYWKKCEQLAALESIVKNSMDSQHEYENYLKQYGGDIEDIASKD